MADLRHERGLSDLRLLASGTCLPLSLPERIVRQLDQFLQAMHPRLRTTAEHGRDLGRAAVSELDGLHRRIPTAILCG